VTEPGLDVINIAGTFDLLSSPYWKLKVGSDKKKKSLLLSLEKKKKLIKTDIGIKIKFN
jgi:hypothetical protein